MITVRRASQRRHQLRKRQEAWLTFHPHDQAEDREEGFGPLEVFKEGRLPPRAAAQLPVEDAEILTYVHEGTLHYEDTMGQAGLLRAGEFQRTTARRGMRRSESNASSNQWAHVFQIWLRPAASDLTEGGTQQRRFSRAQRHGGLCVVASPDGRQGSLLVHQDAFLFSGILDAGRHVVHELASGRSAWLHVVAGEVRLGDELLGAGDGAGFHDERAVSVTTTRDSEILLIDLVVHEGSDHGPRVATERARRVPMPVVPM
ncbi:MAG: pirin family protein [Myxococcales bacterium]|nr:pirin family protein [Myxococcales bacterium]MCB9625738.1 pirin family protein [Sandaracinaceae bacterium]